MGVDDVTKLGHGFLLLDVSTFKVQSAEAIPLPLVTTIIW